MMTIDELLNGLTWVYFAVFVFAVFFSWRFSVRLRQKHPSTWQELGSPSFLNNSIQNSFRSSGFVLSKKYEKLGDLQLNFYGRWARIGFFAVLGFLLALLALTLMRQTPTGV